MTRISSLVSSSAHSAGTGGAALLLENDGAFSIAAQHGKDAALMTEMPEALVRLLTAGLDEGPGSEPQVQRGSTVAGPILFSATADVTLAGRRIGLLAVYDSHPHELSAAQEYVLKTLAMEIGDQLQLARLLGEQDEWKTARSNDNERLRLLESVVVNANDAVLITEAEPLDLPGPRILYANAAFTRTTGYSLEEVLGQTPRILHGPLTDRQPLERLKAALREWKPVEMELLNYRKDGSTFWVELSIVPVADETGWFTHWVSVQRDVSERKANEENAVRFRLAEARNEVLASEIQERRRSEAELAHAAFHDHLTGLRNRAYFMDKLKSSVERARNRPPYQSAVLFLDLDHFKVINDQYGHRIGDLMLIEVAQRLKGCSRPHDTVARMGGDEFTILLDDVESAVEAIAVADRIQEMLTMPIRLAEHEVLAGASIGLSLGSYDDPEHFLRDADTAMYRAKEEGGGRSALFDEAMHSSAMKALHTRVELRAGLERGEFKVFYQPLIDSRTQSVCGVEALVRWHHPERGLVPPLEFIGIAEETGMILNLGLWVLQEACRHLSEWRRIADLGSDFKISVNVSSRQLDDLNFYSDLVTVLQESGIDAHDLQLEITESVFLKNPERVGALLTKIRSLGIQIACDDFGTGYSSLSYLQTYPIDMIKIDQSFVSRLESGDLNVAIIQMIIELARVLKMDVSAEGVENERQRDALGSYGCNVVQGYLYSPPVPFEAMTEMLRSAAAPRRVSPGKPEEHLLLSAR